MDALPTSVEVAIVGGGFAGLSTAWWLVRRGIGAIVLEREPTLGVYASGRSAGLGRQLAEEDATSALTVRGAQLLREHFVSVWAPTGGILSFDDPAHLAAYTARAVRLGVPVTTIDRAEVVARWPQLAGLVIEGALAIPSDGVIAVQALVQSLAAGSRVATNAVVQRVEPTARGARLTTSQGTLDARVVVDAAGAWAGELVHEPPLDAYKRHVFILAAAAGGGSPFLWHLGRDEHYVREEAGAILTSPCDELRTAAADQLPDAEGEARLRAIFARMAPALRDAVIVRRWACQRSFTPDRRMRLGRDPERRWLVWAAGLGGHGATAAPAVGEVVAAAVIAALD